MTKRIDPDILALKQAVRALNKSTSRRMLKANLEFLIDRFWTHPTKTLPDHLKPSSGPRGAAKGGE